MQRKNVTINVNTGDLLHNINVQRVLALLFCLLSIYMATAEIKLGQPNKHTAMAWLLFSVGYGIGSL